MKSYTSYDEYMAYIREARREISQHTKGTELSMDAMDMMSDIAFHDEIIKKCQSHNITEKDVFSHIISLTSPSEVLMYLNNLFSNQNTK